MTAPNVYLAARYSRRLELCGYRDQLTTLGLTVNARWLNGDHQIGDDGTPIGEDGAALVEDDGQNVAFPADDRAARLRTRFALDDYEDVKSADLLVAFTEPPRQEGGSRGGRHVEMGIALGLGIPVMVVGPRENIFAWLPQVDWFPDWDQAHATLTDCEDTP